VLHQSLSCTREACSQNQTIITDAPAAYVVQNGSLTISIEHGSEARLMDPEPDPEARQDREGVPQGGPPVIKRWEQDYLLPVKRWIRLIRRIKHIRKLQRFYGYLGHYLQLYPGTLRRRLQSRFPNERQALQ
jgi:hypothetical protein